MGTQRSRVSSNSLVKRSWRSSRRVVKICRTYQLPNKIYHVVNCTHPEPEHHLHKGKGKDHTVLQSVQTTQSCSGGIRRGQDFTPAGINKQREARIHKEPARSNANPDTPVDSQGFGDI